MNPETSPIVLQNPTNGQPPARRKLIVIGFLIVLAILGLLLASLTPAKFRIVSTNPNTDSVAAISPFMHITFNKPLSSSSVSIDLTPDALSSYTVNGSELDINFNNPLNTSKTYTLTIKSISDTSGDHITNKTLTFKPQDISYDHLPADQQHAIQAQEPSEPSAASQNAAPTFDGIGSLLDYGLTSNQINELTAEFSNFAPKVSAFSIDDNTIVAAPHDPNSTSTIDSLSFNVTVGGTLYKATVNYSGFTSIQLILHNYSNGAQVFDSGMNG